jgi:hypothetical protein
MELTKAEAIQHLKDLCKMYPNTYGHWDKLPYSSKQEDWDSYKDTLFRDGHITERQYKTWGDL